MAFVSNILQDERDFKSAHPSHTECKYMIGEVDGRKIIQLNSYGSETRDVPGKLSQTLQFDERTAKHLFDILKKEFGFRE